jgi:hypothetical protein
MLMQADAFYEIHLNFIPDQDAPEQFCAVSAQLLGDRENGGNVVAGVRIVGREEGVVEIEFAHGGAIRPGRPLRIEASVVGHSKNGGSARARMAERLAPRIRHGPPVHRGDRDRGVVDHAIDDHVLRVGINRRIVGSHSR